MTSTVTLPRIYLFLATLVCFLLIGLTIVLPTFAQDLPAGRQDATSSTSKKDAVKERVQDKKETRKDAIAQRKENLAERRVALKEKMATREAALKLKLAAFRDKAKATIAERVNTNLNKINEKQTDAMLKHLNKMSGILTKLETRVNEAKPDIKDPAAAKVAIADAKAKIASAEAAVGAQAEKDYTITVTSEATVKADAKTMRDALHTDLKAVREAVIAAKQAVAAAIREAKSGK